MMNLGLLGKWRWRFLSELDSLWRKIIYILYDEDGGFLKSSGSGLRNGVWDGILGCHNAIDNLGFGFRNSFIKRVYNGESTSFWQDRWVDSGPPLKLRYPRLFALETIKDSKVRDMYQGGFSNWNWRHAPRGTACDDLSSILSHISNISLVDGTPDRWFWSLDTCGCFTVKRLRSLIQSCAITDANSGVCHIWNCWSPIKVNVCLWRAALDRLPTLVNLAKRGVPVENVLCPFCKRENETVSHCLIKCPASIPLWKKLESWWSCSIPSDLEISSLATNAFSIISDQRISKAFFATCFILVWLIWKRGNRLVHAPEEIKFKVLEEDVFSQLQQISLLYVDF